MKDANEDIARRAYPALRLRYASIVLALELQVPGAYCGDGMATLLRLLKQELSLAHSRA